MSSATLWSMHRKKCSSSSSFVDKGLIERLNHVVNYRTSGGNYTEAIELLEKNNDKFDYKVYWGCDLQTEHERYLTEQIFKRPVFVTDYPKEIKAFYMKLNDDNKTVAAMEHAGSWHRRDHRRKPA